MTAAPGASDRSRRTPGDTRAPNGSVNFCKNCRNCGCLDSYACRRSSVDGTIAISSTVMSWATLRFGTSRFGPARCWVRSETNMVNKLLVFARSRKYMVRRRVPPSQGWRTFLRNHADGIAAMDLFVVPTISFRPLYGLLVMGHGRRQLLWFGVTAHPTAEWIANQLTEACGWEQIPRYLIRDRDGAYGEIFIRRVRSIGIRDRPTSPRSPWQNAY